MTVQDNARTLVQRITALPARDTRLMIAIAGPPGSGKSTLAEAVVEMLTAAGKAAVLMPMDGFHLDNRLLEPAGLLPRKGAPETFDFGGLASALARIRDGQTVLLPVFDRSREEAIAGAARIGPETRIVVVEGNYLLLDEDPWRDLAAYWDLAAFLTVPEDELERRLIARWLSFGHDARAAATKAQANDLPNARRVVRAVHAPDLVLE
ncbi:nucleoside/nucleotide kinase family protein [Tropicibacter oceani]|uniref:Nucleoside/nucleotide kinase family protein n=1 Tax=Tropicibacter oceani TaxID=3058420 RepID=A0ABY8QM26_9RHOB|nr:nucleoside/nucleotide kinase family protein [Tropicibacter oceani]WGW05690.1 nucleoside/nucleotide kinase family protein [Tropicibacter oceani]